MTALLKRGAVTGLVLGALAAAAPAAAQEYVPFVTDFPRPGGAAEFIPFVTDFGLEPRPAGPTVVSGAPERPAAPVAAQARDWADLTVGAVTGFAAAVALLGMAAALRRARAHASRRVGAETS